MPFYPGAIDYSDGLISVDQALNSPEIIEQRIADIISENLLVDTLFTEGGTVDGGAVIYSKITEKHLFTENDVADRNPGDEYPVVYAARPEPELARVQDFGGKFAVSDEARKRNRTIELDNDTTVLSNTITRKLNRRAIETLSAAVDASDDVYQIAASVPWTETTATGNPANLTNPRALPHATFALAAARVSRLDLGITYTKLLVGPDTHADLRITYGKDLTTVLSDFGLEIVESNYVPVGEAYLVDPGKVGFVQYEEPLTVKTWDDPEHRQTWVQGYAMPVMGVTLPAALTVIKGVSA
jgi:hypothetical protein